MGLYERYVLPRIVHLACSARTHMRQREKVIPLATGRVLEVGMGTGLNLPYYDVERVEQVYGLEPSEAMTRRARQVAAGSPLRVEFLRGGGEAIPMESTSVDTVVLTYTLCTIPESIAALREMARVLRPGGRLLFCEHGVAPDPDVRRWQDRVNPMWRRLGGGCHLNRDVPRLLGEGGFEIRSLETMYLPGWRPATFNYWGSATPR